MNSRSNKRNFHGERHFQLTESAGRFSRARICKSLRRWSLLEGATTTASTGKATYLSERRILNAPSGLAYSPAGIRQLLESTTFRETKTSQFSHLVLADRLRKTRTKG